jgi:WD40 repeat protein
MMTRYNNLIHYLLTFIFLSSCNSSVQGQISTNNDIAKVVPATLTATTFPTEFPESGNTPLPTSTRTPIPTEIAEDDDYYYDIAVSPDFRTIAVSRVDGIFLYDSLTLDEISFIEREIKYYDEKYYRGRQLPISFSPDGQYIASSDGIDVYFVDLSSSEKNPERVATSLIPSFVITEISVSQNNRHLILRTEGDYEPCQGTGVNYALYDLDKNYWGLVFDRYSCAFPSASHVRFTETGKAYFFVLYTTGHPSSMDVVDLSTNALIESVVYRDIGYPSTETYYDISPNGEIFASFAVNEDGTITTLLIDAETNTVIDEVDGVFSLINYPSDKKYGLPENWSYQFQGTKFDVDPCNPPEYEVFWNDYFRFNDTHYNLIYSFENFSTYYTNTQIELWDTASCEMVKAIILRVK